MTYAAYGKSSEFNSTFDSLLDANTQTVYCNKVADRWLAFRLESIAAAIVGLAAVFATQVVLANGGVTVEDTSSYASLAGMSLSFTVTATGMMQVISFINTFLSCNFPSHPFAVCYKVVCSGRSGNE